MERQSMIRKILIFVLSVVCIISCIITGCTVYDHYHEESYTTGTITPVEPVEVVDIQDDLKELSPLEEANQNKPLSQNSIGWLKIPDADIDDPVQQTTDNEFYLNHDEYDKYSIWGSYFFSCDNNVVEDSLDKVTLIFGHSNGNSAHLKFSTLKKFKDVSFAQDHQYIELWIGNTKTIWQIFSVCDYPVGEHTIMNVNPNDKAFEEEVSLMKQLSYNQYNVDVSGDDKILVLATCSGDNNYSYRFLVCAKRIS